MQSGKLRTSTPLLSIGTVRQLTGMTPRQIRYWESRGFLQPERTPGRHRLFSLADVDRLLYIRRLREKGMRYREIELHLWRKGLTEAGLTDQELYRRVREQLMEDQVTLLQGQLARLYRSGRWRPAGPGA